VSLPPLTAGAALVLWGWHSELLEAAVPMAIALEAARWVPWRWSLTDRDFDRVSDLSTVALLAVIVYQFDRHAFHAIYEILELAPLVAFALVLAQAYSTRERVRLTALFLSVRRAHARGDIEETRSIDLGAPYFVLCLLAASAGELRTPAFFLASLGLVGWVLAARRPRRFPAALWAVAFVAGAGLAHAGSRGVVELRVALEPVILEWLEQHMWRYRSPYRAYTAIGELGTLKASDRIVLRIEARGAPPHLLHEASYRIFSRGGWLAAAGGFEALTPVGDGTTWVLEEESRAGHAVRVSAYLVRGRGLLAVPNGSYRVDTLPVEDLARNALGTLRVGGGPGVIDYRVRYDPGARFAAAPEEVDLELPSEHAALLAEVVAELGLAGAPPREVLAGLERHFARRFHYSLAADASRRGISLAAFLREHRKGHCEYFATAAVLLLRAAGVPARYATGYSVQEWSELEQRFVVRRRHAHAWARAYVDGQWRDFDVTPASWNAIEAAQAAWWQEAYDLGSWLAHRFQRWRWGQGEGGDRTVLAALLVPLVLVLAWRLRGRDRVARSRAGATQRAAGGAGADSEFYLIEARLIAAQGLRPPGEPLARWLERLARERGEASGATEARSEILPLHYRHRFDPAGLGTAERALLRRRVRTWLARYGRGP